MFLSSESRESAKTIVLYRTLSCGFLRTVRCVGRWDPATTNISCTALHNDIFYRPELCPAVPDVGGTKSGDCARPIRGRRTRDYDKT